MSGPRGTTDRPHAGSGPHPREVPGYEAARAAGTLPTAPALPPALTVLPSARSHLHRFVLLTFGSILLVVAVSKVLDRLGSPRGLTSVALGAGTVVVASVVLRSLGTIGRRSLAELEHGYTTLELTFGGFWVGEGHATRREELRTPWDYRGTWLLHHRDGRVLRAPDRSVDPPGWYPSPHRPGRREVWTGAAWLDHYDP